MRDQDDHLLQREELLRLRDENRSLRDEVELWKDRWGAEAKAHEDSVKHAARIMDEGDGRWP